MNNTSELESLVTKVERMLAAGVDRSNPTIRAFVARIERLGGKFELLIKDDEPLQESKTNGRKSKKTVPQTDTNGVELAADAGRDDAV